MKQFQYTITDPDGMHARPAGNLVKQAKAYTSATTVSCDDKEADGKKLFALMGLGAKKGSELTVTCTGEDEEAAIATLEEFLRGNM